MNLKRMSVSSRQESSTLASMQSGANGDDDMKTSSLAGLEPGERLGYLLHDVSRLRKTFMDKWLKPLGITRSQWWVLANLARHSGESMKQTELANTLTVGKVALGGLLDRLEESGYIARRIDPEDRRAKRIRLTRAGSAMLSTIEERAKALNQEMQHGVTFEEVVTTEDILQRLKQHLVNVVNKSPDSGDATDDEDEGSLDDPL
jgi:DNA-binding MarR family transcriptional regulator